MITRRFFKSFNNSRLVKDRFFDEEEMEEATASPEISYSALQASKKSAQSFFKYIRNYMEEHPEKSNQEVKKDIIENFNVVRRDIITSLPSLRSDTIRYDVVEHFSKNKREFLEIYDRLIKEEERTGKKIVDPGTIRYDSSFEKAKEQFVYCLIGAFRDTKDAYEENCGNYIRKWNRLSSKQKREFVGKNSIPKQEVSNYNYLSKFFKDEREGILEFFDEKKPFLHTELKKDYVSALQKYFEIMKKLGFLEKYIDQNNRQMSQMNLQSLAITPEEVANAYGNFDSMELLNKLDLNQLLALNVFWANRLTKEFSGMADGLVLTSSMDLWEEIRRAPIKMASKSTQDEDLEYYFDDSELDISLPDNVYDTLNEKMRFLEHNFKYYFEKEKGKIDIDKIVQEERKVEQSGLTVVRRAGIDMDFGKDLFDFYQDVHSDYQEYFSRINGGVFKENDFWQDFKMMASFENVKDTLYTIKDNLIDTELFNILSNSQDVKNWGMYIDDQNGRRNSNFVIFGIDVDGLNMPVRLHIPESKLREFIRVNNLSSYFPLYQGEKDFRMPLTLRNISTPILMPMTSSYEKKVEKALESAKEGTTLFKFLSHVASLSRGKGMPDHLKDSVLVKKKTQKKGNKKGQGNFEKKIKKVFKPRFYNIDDRKIYVKNGVSGSETQYKEDTEYGVR